MSHPDTEELLAELRNMKVSDLLMQTCGVVASLAHAKLHPDSQDLEQCRLGIEALKALQPLLPEDAAAHVRQLVSNLQLAYAEAAS